MRGYYTLDEDGNPQKVEDSLEGFRFWVSWMEGYDIKEAFDSIKSARGGSDVSTVFLGMDHRYFGYGPPVLWETLVFGGSLAGEMERYTSRADAITGHAAMVKRVKAAEGVQ